uniref:Uncharacterized protein n=1 Tax=Heliothis virescens TaxID=7102 RepID=A0A2A4JMY5_HELVI
MRVGITPAVSAIAGVLALRKWQYDRMVPMTSTLANNMEAGGEHQDVSISWRGPWLSVSSEAVFQERFQRGGAAAATPSSSTWMFLSSNMAASPQELKANAARKVLDLRRALHAERARPRRCGVAALRAEDVRDAMRAPPPRLRPRLAPPPHVRRRHAAPRPPHARRRTTPPHMLILYKRNYAPLF